MMEKFRRDDIDKAVRALWCALADAADESAEDLTSADIEIFGAITKHHSIQNRLEEMKGQAIRHD